MSNKFTAQQAYALANMGRGVPEYNEGVLAMLGMGEIARNYAARRREVDSLVAERDALPQGEGFDALLNPSAEHRAAQERINEVVQRLNRAWAPIEELIREAAAIINSVEGDRQP